MRYREGCTIVADGEGRASTEPSWVIGTASSAGGLEALTTLLQALPAGTGAAFVVAQHMAPDRASLLTQLLARQCQLTVVEAADGDRLRPDHVHVCPPGRDIVVQGGRLALVEPEARPGVPHPSGDRLFDSLAQACGERCVAIVLSGTGTDGSYGVRSVREAGGITLAQDLATAKHDGMPASAIESGCIDVVLPPFDMGSRLPSILAGLRDFSSADRAEADLSELMTILLARTHVDFRDYKETTLRRRIQRRMAAQGVTSLEDYVAICRGSVHEVGELYRDLLISVTRFFRDPEEFLLLRNAVAERVELAPDQPLRLWVAGCATGEEAYSVVAVVADALGGLRNLTKDRLQVFATDIDRDALRVARAGRYLAAAANDIPRHYLERYFVLDGTELSVRPELRQHIMWSHHNVFGDAPFINIDLATLRNVLIYFNPRLQERTLARLHFALRDDGLLFLGRAEKPPASPVRFQLLGDRGHIWRKVGFAAGRDRRDRLAAGTLLPSHASFGAEPRVERRESDAERLFGALVRQVGADALLVNADNQILAVYGDVSAFVSLAGGIRPKMDLTLLRRPFRAEAQSLALLALKRDRPMTGLWHDRDRPGRVRLVAYPLLLSEPDARYVLLAFEVEEGAPAAAPAAGAALDGAEMAQLQAELAATKEMLQQTIEELQTTNEELQSLNEEVQSANEELEASNEQLKTSNEELSSTNEELITVNEELQVSGSELVVRTGELAAVLQSAPIKVVAVDTALQITNVSRMAVEVFDLDPETVVGTHLSLALMPPGYPDLVPIALRAVRERKVEETTFEDGPFLVSLRCAPWADRSGGLRGAVMVFNRLDMTRERILELEREAFREMVEQMEDVSHFRFDVAEGRVHWSERVFHIHGLDPAQGEPPVDRAIDFYHPDDRDRVRALFERCVSEGVPFSFRARLVTSMGAERAVQSQGMAVRHPETGKVVSVVGVFRERPGDDARAPVDEGPSSGMISAGAAGRGE